MNSLLVSVRHESTRHVRWCMSDDSRFIPLLWLCFLPAPVNCSWTTSAVHLWAFISLTLCRVKFIIESLFPFLSFLASQSCIVHTRRPAQARPAVILGLRMTLICLRGKIDCTNLPQHQQQEWWDHPGLRFCWLVVSTSAETCWVWQVQKHNNNEIVS